jgi:hypothetical protein
MLEKEVVEENENESQNEKEAGGGAVSGNSQSIDIQDSNLFDQHTSKRTHKYRLKSAPVEAITSMGTTGYTGSKSNANIDWLRLVTQSTSPKVLNELNKRVINYVKPPPLPFSSNAKVERLQWELALAVSDKIKSERRICILRDQIEVHWARQLNQLQQQHKHEQHGRMLLEEWQPQHQEQHHDHRIHQGGEPYHDHVSHHYNLSLPTTAHHLLWSQRFPPLQLQQRGEYSATQEVSPKVRSRRCRLHCHRETSQFPCLSVLLG